MYEMMFVCRWFDFSRFCGRMTSHGQWCCFFQPTMLLTVIRDENSVEWHATRNYGVNKGGSTTSGLQGVLGWSNVVGSIWFLACRTDHIKMNILTYKTLSSDVEKYLKSLAPSISLIKTVFSHITWPTRLFAKFFLREMSIYQFSRS